MYLRALIVMLLFCSQAAFAGVPLWRVTEVAGAVQLQHGGRTVQAARGATLDSGDTVITGANGRAVLVRGQEYVIVSARSRLRLPPAAEARGIVQWLQDFGRATFRIEKKETPHFGVRTPYLVALVKGTVFTVSADAGGTMVAVEEGRVEVATSDGGARQMVEAGMAATLSAARPAEIDVRPAAEVAGAGSAEAERLCAADGARSCGPKLAYETVDSAETVLAADMRSGDLSGPAATPGSARLSVAMLDLGATLAAAPTPAPAPAAPAPAAAAPASPAATPAPAPAPPAAAATPPASTPAPSAPPPAPAPAAPPPPPASSGSGTGSNPNLADQIALAPPGGSSSGSGSGAGTASPPPTDPAPPPPTTDPVPPPPATDPVPPPPATDPVPPPPTTDPVPPPPTTDPVPPPPAPDPVPPPPAPELEPPRTPPPPPPPEEPKCRLISLLIICI